MKIDMKLDRPQNAPERVFIGAAVLKSLRGKEHVEAQLFRAEPATGLEALKGQGLVAAADPALPPELLAGATEEAALECLLEAFTAEEARAIAAYLQERYEDQVESLVFCPIDLPVPLGVGPLAKIPETGASGFVNFDLAPDYPLKFKFRGYYDLAGQ